MLRLLPLAAWLLSAGVAHSELREPWVALLGLPGVLFAPGWGLARRLMERWEEDTLLHAAFYGFWLSIPFAVAGWAATRLTGSGNGLLACTLVGVALGLRASPPLGAGSATTPSLKAKEAWGVLAALALGLGWFWIEQVALARPLERQWWVEDADTRLPEEAADPAVVDWADAANFGPGGWRLRDPDGAGSIVPGDGPVLLLLQGPVGATVSGVGVAAEVVASPTVRADEGAVWRYVERGVGGVWLPPSDGPLPLTLSHPAESTLYAFASLDAMWVMHGSGELVFTHYYQLLNMVEQLRWAEDRWVTDVQPPLWTWVLGPALALDGGGQPTANILHAYSLVLCALAGLLFVRRHAPNANWAAWAIPGAATVVVGKLVLEPGSSGMPDTLYAAAIVASLCEPVAAFGLAAQLLRYPGYAVALVGALLGGDWRGAARLTAVVFATAAAFGLGGALTGALDGWLRTVGWEAGPEHWHGEYDPIVLLGRAPEFYRLWFVYSGGTLVLGLLGLGERGPRVALGTALLYSLLLCTIDHTPTHYFAPLVLLSAAAVATGPQRRPVVALASSLLGLGGLLIFWIHGTILA